MRAIVVVFVAIVLLAAAALALAPASLVAPSIAKLTSSHVALADVRGTVWNGQATLVGDDGARIPLAWTTERLPLARGEVRVHLVAPDAAHGPRGDIEWNSGRVAARNVSFTLPAAWIANGVAKSLPVGVAGDVGIAIDALDWSSAAARGDVRIGWRNARIEAPGALSLELGNVTAHLAGDGNQLAGPIANDGGELAVTGNIAARPDGGGEANLLLTPRWPNETLARALSAMGTPDGTGYRMRLQWRAR
jgi:hypothetical protein